MLLFFSKRHILRQTCAFQPHFYAKPKIHLRRHVCSVCGVSHVCQMVITNGVNWSLLELEIEKRDKAELTKMVIIIGANWSQGELEI